MESPRSTFLLLLSFLLFSSGTCQLRHLAEEEAKAREDFFLSLSFFLQVSAERAKRGCTDSPFFFSSSLSARAKRSAD